MKPGDEMGLTGGDLAFGGDCVCRTPDNFVVFVPLLAPGDSARVRAVHVRSTYARGGVVRVESPGPDRVEPPCPWFGDCGGCQWMHVSLAAQRRAKERIVRSMLAPM